MSTNVKIRSMLEEWAVGVIAALTDDSGADLFKTVEQWQHQIGLAGSGLESLQRYAPCAFVKYQPDGPEREGNDDLNQVRRLAIAICQYKKNEGASVSRFGSDSTVGALELAERVVAAIEDTHPGVGYDCDHFRYEGESEIIDHPDYYGLELYFVANNLLIA